MDAHPQTLVATLKKKLNEEELEELIMCMNSYDNYLYELVCNEFKAQYPLRAQEIFVNG